LTVVTTGPYCTSVTPPGAMEPGQSSFFYAGRILR
jgi:hypothetical protein